MLTISVRQITAVANKKIPGTAEKELKDANLLIRSLGFMSKDEVFSGYTAILTEGSNGGLFLNSLTPPNGTEFGYETPDSSPRRAIKRVSGKPSNYQLPPSKSLPKEDGFKVKPAVNSLAIMLNCLLKHYTLDDFKMPLKSNQVGGAEPTVSPVPNIGDKIQRLLYDIYARDEEDGTRYLDRAYSLIEPAVRRVSAWQREEKEKWEKEFNV